MKLYGKVLLAILLAATVLAAQEVETTLAVPQVPSQLSYNPDNDRVYCALYGDDVFGSLVAIDGTTNQIAGTLGLHYTYPGGLCVDLENNRIYCAGSNGSPWDDSLVTVIDGRTDSVIAEITVATMPGAVCYNPQENKLYCVCEMTDEVYVIDCATNTIRTVVKVGSWPVAMIYAPEVNRVYVADRGSYTQNDYRVSVIDGTTDSLIRHIFVGMFPTALCWNSLDQKVYCANTNDGTVAVIDAATNHVDTMIRVTDHPIRLCWNMINNRVYCGDEETGDLLVIDCFTNRVVRAIGLGGPPAALLANWTNFRLYCSVPADSSVVVIDCSSDRIVRRVRVGAEPGPMCLNYRRHGRVYVGNRLDRSVSVILDTAQTGVDEARPDQIYPPIRITQPRRAIAWIDPRLPKRARACGIDVFDIRGGKVASLQPGFNDVSRLSSGTYFVRVKGDKRAAKIVIQR